MLDYYVLASSLMLAVGFYLWVFRGEENYFDRLGTALVIIFIVLLLAAAVMFSIGNQAIADQLSECAYFSILIGVIFKAISMKGKKNE